MKKVFWVVTLVTLLCSLSAEAQVPHLMRYQGVLLDHSGQPLEGVHTLNFRIYDAASGGNLLWAEGQTGIPVTQGSFSVLLGQVLSLSLPFDKDYYLTTEVDSDGEMSPRQKITSSPYAIRAEVAEKMDGVIYTDSSGTVGINTTNPLSVLHVRSSGPNHNAILTLDGNSAEGEIDFMSNSSSPRGKIYCYGGSLLFQAMDGTDDLTITRSGNVGIGTTSPGFRLTVDAASVNGGGVQVTGGVDISPTIRMTRGSDLLILGGAAGNGDFMTGTLANDAVVYNSTANRLHFGTNRTIKMSIQSDGNVGIGTTSPTEKLEVEGNVKAQGYITGDIVFQKDDTPLWRMYEDEKGLYLESLLTHKRYRLSMEELPKK